MPDKPVATPARFPAYAMTHVVTEISSALYNSAHYNEDIAPSKWSSWKQTLDATAKAVEELPADADRERQLAEAGSSVIPRVALRKINEGLAKSVETMRVAAS